MAADELDQRLSQLDTAWSILKQAHGGSTIRRQAARTWLLERYAPAVTRYLSALASSADEAAELLQRFAESLLDGKFHHAWAKEGKFRHYLKTGLFHLKQTLLREKSKQGRQIGSDDPSREPEDTHTPELEHEEQWRLSWREMLIERALADLEREQPRKKHDLYTVLSCRMDHKEMRSHELAAVLSKNLTKPVTAGWVRKRLFQARRRFAQLLIDEVALSLEEPTRENIEEELADLGLLAYCVEILETHKAVAGQ